MWGLGPRLEVARGVVPVIRECLLVCGVELERIALGLEGDNAQPSRPLGCGRRRVELDAHLAEDSHGPVAERLEQPVGGRVGFETLLWILCAPPRAACSSSCRDQFPDPTPERVRVDVPLDAPKLVALAHRAVADDAVAIADDACVPREVEL